jgi:hypothetical protein
MATTIASDPFTCFYLLLFGLVIVAALCTGRGGRSARRVDVRGVSRLPAWLGRIEDDLLWELTGHNSGRTPIQGSYASGLEVYARQFEEAIERIRLGTMGSRRRERG